MLKPYTLITGMALVLLSANASAQHSGPKPGMTPGTPNSHLRGAEPVNDECAGAISLTVGTTCVGTAGISDAATESLPANADCVQFPSLEANDMWYSFVATTTSTTIDVTGMNDYDVVFEVFEGTCGALVSIGCADNNFPEVPPAESLTETFVAATNIAQTYYVRTYYYNFDNGGTVNPTDFNFSICVYESPAPPANDNCVDAVDQALAVGNTISMSGDNTGATLDTDLGDVAVWHSFTTTECSDVVLNYCVEGSTFNDFYIVLFGDCADLENSVVFGDADQCNAYFAQLPAGTYYVPVLVSTDTPSGAYTVDATATACDVYCAASSGTCDEFTANVTIGTIDNASGCGPTYQNFTDLSTVLVIGNDHAITVTNNPDAFYEGDQCTVWVDWNQDFDFEDEGETFTLTTADAFETFTGNIVPPVDAALGATRMRIRMNYDDEALPCGVAEYGDVEDYTVVVENPVGIAEEAAGNWNVFPNPSNGNITIAGLQVSGAMTVQLHDMTGRLVYTTNRTVTANQAVSLELAGQLATGTYQLSLVSPIGRTVRPVMVR